MGRSAAATSSGSCPTGRWARSSTAPSSCLTRRASQTLQDWGVQDFGPIAASNMRFISLDPDGTSMWVGSLTTAVWRLDTTVARC